jgi:hypothetical protein
MQENLDIGKFENKITQPFLTNSENQGNCKNSIKSQINLRNKKNQIFNKNSVNTGTKGLWSSTLTL